MTMGKNSQLNNNSPINKMERLSSSTLISQKQVGDEIRQINKWDKDQIENRQKKIVKFAIKYWNTESA